MTKKLPMQQIIIFYYRKSAGHWFDKDTMRFFKTRLPKWGYEKDGDYFFVTSETNPSGERKYTIRRLLHSGAFCTGKFFNYETRKDAEKDMMTQLKQEGEE